MTVLPDQERLVIESACRDLIARYAVLVDDGRADEVPHLFTEDGSWTAPGVTMEGRDELVAGFGRRARNTSRVSRHVCTNFHLSQVTEDEALGSVYLTLFRHDRDGGGEGAPPDARPALVGVYRDRFVCLDGRWLIADRRLEVDFIGAPT